MVWIQFIFEIYLMVLKTLWITLIWWSWSKSIVMIFNWIQMILIALVAAVAAAPAELEAKAPIAIVRSASENNDDGSYSFRFSFSHITFCVWSNSIFARWSNISLIISTSLFDLGWILTSFWYISFCSSVIFW